MAIRLARHEPTAVQALGEERAAVHEKGRTGGHVGCQDRGDHQTKRAREEQVSAGKSERALGIGERRYLPLRDETRNDQPHEGPPDRADPLDVVAEKHADAAGPLVATCPDCRQLMRLRHDADQPVNRQHEDHPWANA